MTGGRALLSDGNFFILACTAGWWRRGYAEAGGVGRSEPPCHADAWLLSLVVSQRQTAAADELSGVADELLSLQVSQRQSAPVDELSGVVYRRAALSPGVSEAIWLLLTSSQVLQTSCSLSRCLRGNLAPADELSGVADELLSLQVSQRQSAPADELRRCRRLTQPTAQSNSFCHPKWRVRK